MVLIVRQFQHVSAIEHVHLDTTAAAVDAHLEPPLPPPDEDPPGVFWIPFNSSDRYLKKQNRKGMEGCKFPPPK